MQAHLVNKTGHLFSRLATAILKAGLIAELPIIFAICKQVICPLRILWIM
jgi:hypothetical protein